ncbi:acyl carrier protein [Amycolatopsis balhimycina DSM 5908]|uniref:Acyl carrier protein n=1 Tax=Amycolatopsis balhimycina DSM 5908 TaxID=1081091 RepID=A0A428WLA4_AMYBA|nr:acyl carrier protein [Amycolatopsis balhimycina]RSM43812.1 acyl carrier protein [Amycolatopsis balhimycina DSM 5908]
MSDVTGTLVGLVEGVTDNPEISAFSKFESLGNWTSLAALRLLTQIESTFGVSLDLRAYFKVADVAELSTLVSAAVVAP